MRVKRVPGTHKPESIKKRTAVTIGIGILANDGGIVISADRQITQAGGYKHEDNKTDSYEGQDCSLIFSFAGDPDDAKNIQERIKEEIEARMRGQSGAFNYRKAHKALQEIYKDRHAKYLHTLVGVHFETSPPALFLSLIHI